MLTCYFDQIFLQCSLSGNAHTIRVQYTHAPYDPVSVGVSPDSWVRQWVRVHKARVRVRVHQARVRVHQVWVRVHWTSVRVRVYWTRVRVPSPSPVGQSPSLESASPAEARVSPDPAWTHESNNRKVLYFNLTFNHIFAEPCIDNW